MSGKMKIALDPQTGGVAVVRLAGRLDFTSVTEARDQFASAIAAGHRKLIVDLSKVEFVDSAGLGSSSVVCAPHGKPVAICALPIRASRPRCCSL